MEQDSHGALHSPSCFHNCMEIDTLAVDYSSPKLHTNRIFPVLPGWSYSQKCLRATGFKEEEVKRAKSPFTSFLFELCAFGTLLNISNAEAFSWSQGSLWIPCVRYLLDKMNKFISGWSLDWFESRLGKYFPSVYDFRDSGMLFIPGRLSCAFPGAGKRRMFAIDNYINQRLLRPLHKWAMLELKRIPMDGTFKLRGLLRRLVGATHCYSYDLSAATDRWPLRIIFTTVTYLFDRSFASSAVNNCLANNDFLVAFTNNKKHLSEVSV
ncbi:hypothetical protein M9H77_12108 [Catharanthus roseus]|uniref:Uncharacterized protein n=1 Tax=Catharanthus roseus TaxID=4058 RepID=A0ACC0BGH8_CATRO|nr:hypothetical protein M9H77_12108 [Catharanthus roseus]